MNSGELQIHHPDDRLVQHVKAIVLSLGNLVIFLSNAKKRNGKYKVTDAFLVQAIENKKNEFCATWNKNT